MMLTYLSQKSTPINIYGYKMISRRKELFGGLCIIEGVEKGANTHFMTQKALTPVDDTRSGNEIHDLRGILEPHC